MSLLPGFYTQPCSSTQSIKFYEPASPYAIAVMKSTHPLVKQANRCYTATQPHMKRQ